MDASRSSPSPGLSHQTPGVPLVDVWRRAGEQELSLETLEAVLQNNLRLVDPPSARQPSPDSPLPIDVVLAEPLDEGTRRAVTLHIQRSLGEAALKSDHLRLEYRTLHAEWQSSCQRMERLSDKRKTKQNRALGLFTPGLGPIAALPLLLEDTRPSRASRSRANNLDAGYFGDAVRSEAEFQSILASLEDADSRDPNLRAARTTAVVPDMILDSAERDLDSVDDTSGLVQDPHAFYHTQSSPDVWTEDEQQIFLKRFAAYPKQFGESFNDWMHVERPAVDRSRSRLAGKIAEHLPLKSSPQCVLYYYRTKKIIDYRSLVAQRGGGGRRRGGRRGGTKGSLLLANLKASKPPRDDSGSGAITPLYEDAPSPSTADNSAPPTPSFEGTVAPKRSRSDNSGDFESALSNAPKRSRLLDSAQSHSSIRHGEAAFEPELPKKKPRRRKPTTGEPGPPQVAQPPAIPPAVVEEEPRPRSRGMSMAFLLNTTPQRDAPLAPSILNSLGPPLPSWDQPPSVSHVARPTSSGHDMSVDTP